MGLDWNPGPKFKPGCESEFKELWRALLTQGCIERDAKSRRFKEITSTAFDTLDAPRVGADAAATEWARQRFERRKNKS